MPMEIDFENSGTYGVDMIHRRQLEQEGVAKDGLLEAGITFRLISFHSAQIPGARAPVAPKSNEEIDKSVFRGDKSFL